MYRRGFDKKYALQLAGASYMDVHKAGGGINFTVDKTRAASHQQLEDLLLSRLNRMLQSGRYQLFFSSRLEMGSKLSWPRLFIRAQVEIRCHQLFVSIPPWLWHSLSLSLQVDNDDSL